MIYNPDFKYWWSINNWFYNLKSLLRWCGSFFIRGANGWSKEDTYDIDYYLSTIIPQMLKYSRDNMHSHPMDVTEDEWRTILNKIIVGFEAGKKIIDAEYTTIEEYNNLDILFNIGMVEFSKHFFGLWD